jgi:hypothetical protein
MHSSELLGMLSTIGAFLLGGPTVSSLRAVPAVFGTLTVPALWWVVRPVFGPVPALVSAGVLATMRWHVELSRLAYSGIQYPFLVLLSLGFILHAPVAGRRWLALSGAVTGLAMHTYAGARPVPLIALAIFIAWTLSPGGLEARAYWRGYCRSWLAGFAAGFLVGGWYLPWHPEWFLSRIREVGAEVPAMTTLPMNFLRGLGGINLGVADPVYCYPAPGGSPLAGVVAAAVWLPGLVLAMRNSGVVVRAVLGVVLCLGFIGGVFEGPHGMRMFILSPLLAVCAGMALISLAKQFSARLIPFIAVALGIACAGTEMWRYGLGPTGGSSRQAVDTAFWSWEGSLAKRIAEEAKTRPVYLGPDSLNPAGTPIELWAAPVLFLSSGAVRRGPVPVLGEMERENSVMVFMLVSRGRLDILREILPGGIVWAGPDAEPGNYSGEAYAAGPESLRRARVPLDELRELFDGIWKMESLSIAKKYQEALVEGERVASRWPKVGAVDSSTAFIRYSAGQVGEVESSARSAIRKGAKGGIPWLYLGMSLVKQGRFQEAVEAFDRCTREAPDNVGGWAGLIASLANTGQGYEARLKLDEARSRFPGSAQIQAVASQLR